MSLFAGSRLGPYEILAPLGAGGMGEVYRARDGRLAREVAIKVLPADVSSDPSRLRRFEKEARAASALNHPNIVTVHEIGREGSIDFLVMELVAGKTVRELLFSGPLPVKRLLAIAAQVADGLARAHEAGIVHRDMKPENVMVTKDGLVKILDFGLARQTTAGSGSDEASHLPTETGTSPGMIVGTVGYMSPEQAMGHPLDFRSDQFAFGSILFEMATGKRAFQKSTAIDTLSAILHEEPKPLAEASPEAPTPLRWIVERCLSKEPERRYAATRDLAQDLEIVRDRSSEAVSGAVAPARQRSRSVLAISAVAAALAVAATLLAGKVLWNRSSTSYPTFQRLTFRRGFVDGARFSPDGQTIIYSAHWDGEPPHVFLTRPGKSVLVNENPNESNPGFYLAHADGSAPKKLGDGYSSELSGDGRWVVVVRPGPPSRLVLVPTGAGAEKALDNGGIEGHEGGGYSSAATRGATVSGCTFRMSLAESPGR